MAGEAAEVKLSREQAEKTNVVDHDWPRDAFNSPMTKISVAATELVPTRQYANVTIGPVVITRFVIDTGDDAKLAEEISKAQSVCETAIAEARQSVHKMIQQSTDGR